MMIDLPIVPDEIPVTVKTNGGTDVVLHMTPLTDEEYFQITRTADYEYGPDPKGGADQVVVAVRYKLELMPGLFAAHVRRIEHASFGGTPFDPAFPPHQASVPKGWKVVALVDLIGYASGRLTKDEVGNSNGPATDSPTGPTAPQD